MMIISRVSEDILCDINRLIDFYNETKTGDGKLVLSKKQSIAMKKLIKERKKGRLFSSNGEVEINFPDNASSTTYRGYMLYEKDERKRRSKKDIFLLQF